ncbi:hypothetical protein BU15DRAFT_75873 [Melanogaster broomeanus]|nr:hypothetical protein BU15DRAFT_75873 [Melanogaster broomeanus]
MPPSILLHQDILILVCLLLSIEDVLNLMQTCRGMHAFGSLDYLWHKLIAGWDIPLDIPPNVSLTTLSSDFLQKAAINALRLDRRWRDSTSPLLYAKRIISPNSAFVDGLHLLPGGRWLVTLQYEETVRTHVTLWSLKDPSDPPIFRITVDGRVRFLQAHHHHEMEQLTIGIAFARGAMETIRVYNVRLQDDFRNAARHLLTFEATSGELSAFGRLSGMKICGQIMAVVFVPLSSPPSQNAGKLVCVNLLTKAAAVIECPDWSFPWGRLKLFHRYLAIITLSFIRENTSADICFHELPSVILAKIPHPSVPHWPETLALKSSPTANTSWTTDRALALELSDDVLTTTGETCSFSMFGCRPRMRYGSATDASVAVIQVSFDGTNIHCIPSAVPCRALPSVGEVRASPSGRRAVWLNPDPDTRECTLMKFASGRTSGNTEVGPCISVLMPSFSGLPFSPRDFYSFAFDEISCKLAVSLSSGELYMLHY